MYSLIVFEVEITEPGSTTLEWDWICGNEKETILIAILIIW